MEKRILMKNLLKGKKGFTLVELLAVIVILALLIIITANTVLPMLNKTKEKAMVIYAENVLKKAGEAYVLDSMTNGGHPKNYSIEALMGQDDYYGVVRVMMDNNDNYRYSISMFDGKEKKGIKKIDITSTQLTKEPEELVSSDYYTDADTVEVYNTHTKVADYKTFTPKNVNLVDVNHSSVVDQKWVQGITLNGNIQGNLVDGSYWKSSHFISVEEEKNYRLYLNMPDTANNAGYAWYNESFQAVGGSNYTSSIVADLNANGYLQLAVPEGVSFIRFSWRRSYSDGIKLEKV